MIDWQVWENQKKYLTIKTFLYFVQSEQETHNLLKNMS